MADDPRSSPGIKKGIVMTHSPHGKVEAINLESGKVIWRRYLRAEYLSSKGFWGRCSSLLIIDQKKIFAAGGKQVGLVAFSLDNRKIIGNLELLRRTILRVFLLNSGI